MKIAAALSIAYSVLRLHCALLTLSIVLNCRAYKARKVLERELVKHGVPRGDAKKIGAKYSRLKNEIMKAYRTYFP